MSQDSGQHVREIDVGTLIEERRIGASQLQVLLLGVLILFVDGLDFSASNVGAPAILRAFNVERSAMGVVFGSGFFGILVGSFAFGYLGDRIGRRWGAILGVLAYSIPALLSVFASSLDELAALRFLSGLGMGGVVPNVIALLTETAPKRYRVTFVMLAYVGYSMGNAAIAQVAAWFIPAYGWSVVFEVAGAVGLVLSVVLLIALPESIPYLAAKRPEDARLKQLVSRLAPEAAEGEARFVLHRPANETRFTLKLLFDGHRRVATPLLWLGFFSESLTYMTLAAWFSVLLEEAGLVPTQASLVFSYAYVGAMAAIVILARLIDRFGPRAALISASIAAAALIYLGTPGLSATAITIVAILAMAFSSATHQSLNGIVGGFYPTIVRGNGVGYASGMGRAAAIVGPLIAGYLLAAKLPLEAVLASIAAPYIVVAGVCLALDRLQRRMNAAPDATAAPETQSVTSAALGSTP